MRDFETDEHLEIGAIIFPEMDQADFTGPFEVLSRLPDSRFHVLAKDKAPVRDVKGLLLTPDKTLSEAPPLDLLLVPGGSGVNAVMEDEAILSFVRAQAANARIVLSVCTGALICGAAGLLRGRKATTHWASHHFLKSFGAVPINARVAVDGNMVSAAGVTSGLDAAFRVAAMLRGDAVGQELQLYLQYAPEPLFNAGNPETAPSEIRDRVNTSMRSFIDQREIIVNRVSNRLGTAPQPTKSTPPKN
jgi:cyclohexyl-isocyanide hydratase